MPPKPLPDLAEIVRAIKHAHHSATQLAPLTTTYPGFDLEAAYDVAQRVSLATCSEGASVVGRKIGFTNSNLWKQYGVREPIWGYMYDRSVHYVSGGSASCDLSGFTEPKIEPEIVFRFRAAPNANANAHGLLESLEWVAHGFEIVQSHFPSWKFLAPDTVADGGLHGCLFIGNAREIAAFDDELMTSLRSFSLVLSRNGEIMEEGKGSNVLSSPLAAILHLISVLTKQPQFRSIQAGDIVTTGTITAAYSVSPGETWQTEIHGIELPGLTIEFST